MKDPENSNRKKPLSPLELKEQGRKLRLSSSVERHHICLRGALSQSGSKKRISNCLSWFSKKLSPIQLLHTFDLLRTCSQGEKRVESRVRKIWGRSSFTLILQRVLEHKSWFTLRHKAVVLVSYCMWDKHWVGCDVLYPTNSAKDDALEKGTAASHQNPIVTELCGSSAMDGVWRVNSGVFSHSNFPLVPVTEGTKLEPPRH